MTQLYLYICIYMKNNIYILFHILFHYGLSQDIDYSSLCYTVGPCCLKPSSLAMRTKASKPADLKAVGTESKNSSMGY